MSVNFFLPPSPVAPHFLTILNITRSFPCIVTVEEENNYVVNQLIHFSVPFDYGMFQINQLTGEIVAVNGMDFSVSIDTTYFDPFVFPPFSTQVPATIAPAGSRNLYNTQFVPFHSVNGNVGN